MDEKLKEGKEHKKDDDLSDTVRVKRFIKNNKKILTRKEKKKDV